MPPKKESKKAAEKAKQKIVEDKTFGLKNKNKSSKVQKFVEEVKKQASGGNNRKANQEGQKGPSKKELEAQKKAELAELFKPIQVQKVPFGTDPKTVLCAFFKVGQCQKGSKCKFSHDLNIERKSTKIDIYTDKRQEDDTMDLWDQGKLESVIKSKHGNPRTTTDIVCKYFLEAIENSKYGWFWICPNGGDSCKYRHALPPGYVLKKKESKKEDEVQITLEEFLETERHNLGSNLTPITYESFMEWKQRRIEKAALEEAEKNKEKEAAAKSGRRAGLSGRDLFTYSYVEEETNDQEDEGDSFDLSKYLEANAENDRIAEEEAIRQADSAKMESNDYVEVVQPEVLVESVDESLFEGEDLEQLQIEDYEDR